MRGPIYVRGDLAHPDVAVDTARLGMRSLAALALGAINPALSVVALTDPASAKDSDCGALTSRARAPAPAAAASTQAAASTAQVSASSRANARDPLFGKAGSSALPRNEAKAAEPPVAPQTQNDNRH
jgi:hypothetical protein